MKTITNTIYPAFALFAFACFALAPLAQAVNPAPDGGYPGGNTAEGENALFSLISGQYNTAVGLEALYRNQSNIWNTAIGTGALHENQGVGADANTAIGTNALWNNTTGGNNTAVGASALFTNTFGHDNTASGYNALSSNIGGFENTAVGAWALDENSGSIGNTAIGYFAMTFNSDGRDNTAIGKNALAGVHAAFSFNTAVGAQALQNNTGNNNTAAGFGALAGNASGTNNIAFGYLAGQNITTGSNNIVIGANVGGSANDANITRIGKSTQAKTFIGGIYGKTVASGLGVIVNSTGQLGTVQSSARYKQDIKPMDKASEAILALKPVTFRYKKELDPDKIPQFGLIAEEVEKVNPELVARDEEGKIMSVRYDAVNAMLLNEFLKEHQKVQELEATIAQLKSRAGKQELARAQQQKQIETLTEGLQKVGAQLEVSKPAPRTTLNNR